MRCVLKPAHIKFLSKVISTFSKFNNEVRIRTTEDEFHIEVMKGEFALGELIIYKDHFESWDPSSPVDVYFKSKSLRLIFRNSANMSKNLQRMEIWIENQQNLALFKITPKNYTSKVIKLPIVTMFETTKIPIPDFQSYAVHIISDSKTWISGFKIFPNSIDLVTTRFRIHSIKMETGDEKCLAPIMTKFNYHMDEFKFCEIREPMVCTYAIRPVMDFLQIWEKFHVIDSYYDSAQGVPVVFLVKESTFEARLVLAKASVSHVSENLTDSDDDDTHTINVTTNSRTHETPQAQSGTSRQDPRNPFIFRSDGNYNPHPTATLPRPTAASTAPAACSTTFSMQPSTSASHFLPNEGFQDEFDDDDFDNLPTHTLTQPNGLSTTQVVCAGGDEFDDDGDENYMEAINETTRAFSQSALKGHVEDMDETFGEPVHHSTQSESGPDQNGNQRFLNDTYPGEQSFGLSLNISAEKFEQQRRFFGLNVSNIEPSQEYEVLAKDSDEEED